MYGETTARFIGALVNDQRTESNELIVLSLGTPAGFAKLGTRSAQTITLLDFNPTASVSFAQSTLMEGESIQATVSLSSRSLATLPALPKSVPPHGS